MKGGNVNKIKSILAAAAILVSSGAIADPTNVPMEQAFETHVRNLARNPDNPGLVNSSEQLIENKRRQADRGRNQAPGQQRAEGVERVEKVEKVEKVERIERVERPERPERPERVDFVSARDFGRAHRPERPERPGKK
jgi:hypothetical protein